jgi:hypothetical protein
MFSHELPSLTGLRRVFERHAVPLTSARLADVLAAVGERDSEERWQIRRLGYLLAEHGDTAPALAAEVEMRRARRGTLAAVRADLEAQMPPAELDVPLC